MNKLYNIICKNCGKIFYVDKRRKDNAQFCSRDCWYKYRKVNGLLATRNNPSWKERVHLTCMYCGKKFDVRPSRLSNGIIPKYCSKACSYKKMSEIFVGEKALHWKGGKITCLCDYCGKEFEIYKNYIKRGKKFCSQECYWNGRKGKYIKERSSNWRGGISKDPYPFDFDNTLKNFIRERDNYICQVCKLLENGKNHHVHHIDYDKTNINVSNLILLCASCHGKTVSNRDVWTKILKEYQTSREILVVKEK